MSERDRRDSRHYDRDDHRDHADHARLGYEGWRRGQSGGGFGSPFDAWSAGAGFGFAPEEQPHGGPPHRGDDWQPERMVRGRGALAGDRPQSEDYRGRGPKGYRRSDERIQDDVCDRLARDPGIDATDVSVRVTEGAVTLSGQVSSRDQKWRAEDVAETVAGVRDVVNELRVLRT